MTGGRFSTYANFAGYAKGNFVMPSAFLRMFYLGSGYVQLNAAYGIVHGSSFKEGSNITVNASTGDANTEGVQQLKFKSTLALGQIGVGNQWRLSDRVVLGVDWIGLGFVLAHDLQSQGNSQDQAGNDLANRAEYQVESAMKNYLLNCYVGMVF